MSEELAPAPSPPPYAGGVGGVVLRDLRVSSHSSVASCLDARRDLDQSEAAYEEPRGVGSESCCTSKPPGTLHSERRAGRAQATSYSGTRATRRWPGVSLVINRPGVSAQRARSTRAHNTEGGGVEMAKEQWSKGTAVGGRGVSGGEGACLHLMRKQDMSPSRIRV
eukprot:611552-Pyramimonas_sp.AAC.1